MSDELRSLREDCCCHDHDDCDICDYSWLIILAIIFCFCGGSICNLFKSDDCGCGGGNNGILLIIAAIFLLCNCNEGHGKGLFGGLFR